MKEIKKISGIELTYDLEELVQIVENREYDGDEYSNGSCHGHDTSDWFVSQEDFDKDKAQFIKSIKSLESDISPVFKQLKVNKNGALSKNGRNIIFTMDSPTNYSDEYGSHSYNLYSLVASITGDYSVQLVLINTSHKDSF